MTKSMYPTNLFLNLWSSQNAFLGNKTRNIH